MSEDIEEDLDSFPNSALDDNNDNFTQEYSPILEVLINNSQVLKTYARDKIMGLGILKIGFVEIVVFQVVVREVRLFFSLKRHG